MAVLQSKSPRVGEDGLILEPHTLSVVLKCLPREVRSLGPRRHAVVYTCFDVSDQYLAIGSEQGLVWILDLHATRLIRELNDFRGTAISVVALNTEQEHIAYSTCDGQTKVESFTKQMSRGYRIQEKDRQSVVAMTWDKTGTILLCAYSSGKLIKISFQFSGDVMEVTPLLECGSCVVQLSLCGSSLLISTLARSLLLDVESGRITQVGTKERKPGSFGGCLSVSEEEEGGSVPVAYLARPGLRMWTADETGKVVLTTKFRDALSSGQFPRVLTNNWSSGNLQFADSWQFSLVLPWLKNFIVTYHDRTLCVLDPTTSTVAGVLCLNHKITCIATNGKFVYVLCDGIARPLARFTAQTAYLKSIQKIKTSVAKIEDDVTSISVSEENEHVERHDKSIFINGSDGGEGEEERGIVRGRLTSEEMDSPLSSTPADEPSLLSPSPFDSKEESSNEDRELQTHTACGVSKIENQSTSDIDNTTGKSIATDTQMSEPETNTEGAHIVTDKDATNDIETESADMENQSEPTSTTTAEIVGTIPDGVINSDSLLEMKATDPISNDLKPPSNTKSTDSHSTCYTHTNGDPPSVTGPLAMQDLAREVTDLLRPALGKLSIFMRSQDRRKTGNNSGTATPQEASLTNNSEEERQKWQDEGTGTQSLETHSKATHSPKLTLRLGGKIGDLISGDKDKEQDTNSPSPSLSTGVTPAPIGLEEEERRLRMAQAVGEEDMVSERLTQRKRRKRKTKNKNKTISHEKLTDIGDAEDEVSSPQVEPTSDTTKAVVSGSGDTLIQLSNDEMLIVLAEDDSDELPSHNLEEPGHEQEIQEETGFFSQADNTSPGDNNYLGEETSALTNALGLNAHESTNETADTSDHFIVVTPEDFSSPERVVSAPPPTTPPPTSAEDTLTVPEAIVTDSAPDSDNVLDTEEPSLQESNEINSYSDTLQEYQQNRTDLSRLKHDKKLPVRVALQDVDSDPLSQLQSNDDEVYFKPRKTNQDSFPQPTKESQLQFKKDGDKMSASPLELSDNPLYKDDTSDFTTDTESRSRRSSSAKLLSSSRGSSVAAPTLSSSSTFAVKHMKSKGPASLGVSNAVSDLSWEGSLPVPRPRSDRRFTPSASPFEVSNSPGDLSSSFHSSCSNVVQQSKNTTTSKQPLSLPATIHQEEGRRSRDDSGSDFSCDEIEALPVEPEHFSLCAAAVDDSRSSSREPSVKATKSPSPRPGHTHHTHDQRTNKQEMAMVSAPDPDSDIWVTVPHPCRGHVQSICLSDHLLWLVDSRNMVYCTEINTKGKKWELIKHPMQQVSSSPTGNVVWGVYRQNAYIRLGLELSVLGHIWKNTTKNSSLAQKIKWVCADDTGVWAVKNDGQIIFRKGVTASTPTGRVWVEVGRAAGFTSVTACSGVVWATNSSGRLFYRDGVTSQNPSGRKWVDMKAPPLEAVCITQGNIAWIIDGEGKMGFRCGVSHNQPTGKNPWWEVTVSTTLSHSSLPFNSLWQVMTSEGSQFLSSVSSLIHTHLPGHHKLLAVSASNRSGVCVLESGSKIHACWRSTSGYHYSSASKDGVFQLTTWTMFGSGSTGLWVVRDDGELYCVTPQDRFIRIECASTIQMMAVSSTALWVIANNQLWSRQGMSASVPEGISWDYIELSLHLHQRKLRHIACGKRAVWAVDGTGVPHFRFGVHSREPGTGMSPAWVPVDDLSHPLHQITVSHNDWLVWACDDNYNSYVRTGVTPDFPVGEAWDIVPGQPIKQLCAHGRKVYALTPSGNLLCRYGITEDNPQGNYWRQLPGNFVQITVGHDGVLLGLDTKGSILKQQCKTLTVGQDSDFLRFRLDDRDCLDPSWEVV